MKSKVLMGLVLAGLLGSSLYAKYDMQDNNRGMKKGGDCPMMMKKGPRGDRGGFLGALRDINLTEKQDADVKAIIDDVMKKSMVADSAFSKTGFDKDKYIKLMKQKRDNMIESQAEIIDRIYSKVLTKEQKEQIKVLMDLKKEKKGSMMGKRMNFDKNCHGGR